MDVVRRELDIGRADEDVINTVLVGVSVEVEGHAVGGITYVAEASLNYVNYFDCHIFDGVADGEHISHSELTFTCETQV